ncbi:hypothetical protein [Bifidobacterium psychraerophilum]|uniref:hypothetical protein n=1 Tax=Bifidobacterium psychraerophilum TaxID=218140 RepID=UPI0039E7A809
MILNQMIIALTTLVASFGGYFLAGLNERHRDERALSRELYLNAGERGSRLEEAEHALQKETLLALQDAVQQMARLTARVMFFDHMQARKGEYTQLPDSLDQDMYANAREVRRLESRILDPAIRQAVDRFVALSVDLSLLPKGLQGTAGQVLDDQSTAQLARLNDGYEQVSNILGAAIREEISWRPVVPDMYR